MQRLRSGHEVQQLRRDLGLPGLTRVLAQFFQLLRHVVMRRRHRGKAGRVFAGERFDGGFGQQRKDVVGDEALEQDVGREMVKRRVSLELDFSVQRSFDR